MTFPDIFVSLQLALHIILSCILSFTVAQNPVDTYAPTVNVNCPDTPNSLVRTFTSQTQVLNTSETDYIASRESYIISNAWSNWLGNASDIGYNLGGKFPRIGIAIGGEGYRTAQYGAAVLSGLDWRNTTAREVGTGGLLQVASYLSASSGKYPIGQMLIARFDDAHHRYLRWFMATRVTSDERLALNQRTSLWEWRKSFVMDGRP